MISQPARPVPSPAFCRSFRGRIRQPTFATSYRHSGLPLYLRVGKLFTRGRQWRCRIGDVLLWALADRVTAFSSVMVPFGGECQEPFRLPFAPKGNAKRSSLLDRLEGEVIKFVSKQMRPDRTRAPIHPLEQQPRDCCCCCLQGRIIQRFYCRRRTEIPNGTRFRANLHVCFVTQPFVVMRV